MTPPHPRLVAMQRRVLRIRRTVVAASVAAFIAVFSTIYVQMASGNDPALGSASASASTSTSTSTATTDEPAPVTSRQS